MKTNLIIPKTLKVGFQDRKDTYSGKLAYVTFIDAKGVLRKQGSWEEWRDKKIEVLESDNEPRTGFVLNRNVGGVKESYSSWNVRIEKVRVYDPRGFEFEIGIPNLLYILQECTSTKGKGLEGEFVYAWNGTELILLPCDTPEYQASVGYNKLQEENVSAKDMKVGCSYLTKKQEAVVYLGKWRWWNTRYVTMSDENKVKGAPYKHVFALVTPNDKEYDYRKDYIVDSGFTKLAERTSQDAVPQYAAMHDKLAKSSLISPAVKLVVKNPTVINENTYYSHQIVVQESPDGPIGIGYMRYGSFGFSRDKQIYSGSHIFIKNGKLLRNGYHSETRVNMSTAKLYETLVAVCENGAEVKLVGPR